jgi:hypothetical protein
LPPSVVVGSFAFLGFDGLLAVAVGVEVAGAGTAAAWLGLAPPVAGADVCDGAEACAVAEDAAVGVGAAAVLVALVA